jgi:sulfite exporter TauE/SafE
MVGFALATAPGTLAVGWLLQQLPSVRSPRVMRVASLALVTLAAVLIARPIVHLAAQPAGTANTPHCH